MKALVIPATLAVAALSAVPAHAQFGYTVTFDPTQSAHMIQDLAKAEKLYTTTVQTTENVISTYNLAKRMASSPQSLYSSYGSGLPPWLPMLPTKDTYGNTGDWLNSVNKYTGKAASAIQGASITRVATLTGYDKLDSQGKQAVAAQTATLDLHDSISATNLQTVGTVRSNQGQRAADITNLETASHSLDPSQQTELATLQRINQALLLIIRNQQDESQLLQGQTMQQMIDQKDAMDATKMQMLVGQDYETHYNNTANSDSKADVNRVFHY